MAGWLSVDGNDTNCKENKFKEIQGVYNHQLNFMWTQTVIENPEEKTL